MKEDNISSKLPKLGSPWVQFKDWEASMFAYLGRKQLDQHLRYSMQCPKYIQDKLSHEDLTKKLCTDLKINNDTKILNIYNENSDNTPISLMKMSLEGPLIEYKHFVFPIFKDKKKIKLAKINHAMEIQSVLHIFRRTISANLVHYIDKSFDLYESYSTIKQHYEKDIETALITSKRRLAAIQFCELRTYISIFKRRLDEYISHGGKEKQRNN
eukprot:snap_masked-scaffold_58-processed-gene-0.78-mRNA-1 protein AED:1.00 eAED:1.00 QI:0/-1/0/0/-1/1/1/0/212